MCSVSFLPFVKTQGCPCNFLKRNSINGNVSTIKHAELVLIQFYISTLNKRFLSFLFRFLLKRRKLESSIHLDFFQLCTPEITESPSVFPSFSTRLHR